MKRYILLFLAVVLLVSCKDGVNYIFPSGYRVFKERTFTSHPTEIIIYEIRGDVNADSLKNYPIIYNDTNSVQKWVDFNNLNDGDRYSVESIIREIATGLVQDHIPSEELETVIANISSFYFSGYYEKSKSLVDEKFHFYDDFYLLDIKNKKLYRFTYIPGY